MQKLTIPLIISSLVIFTMFLVSCEKEENFERTFETELTELQNKIKSLEKNKFDVDTIKPGLYYIMIKHGEGACLEEGDEGTISYSAFLLDGTKIEDSYEIFPSGGK